MIIVLKDINQIWVKPKIWILFAWVFNLWNTWGCDVLVEDEKDEKQTEEPPMKTKKSNDGIGSYQSFSEKEA